MKYGITMTLACAILASGCNLLVPVQPPKTGGENPAKPVAKSGTAAIESKLTAGVQKPIAYKTREAKVDVMAKAFSVSKNQGLGRAADSFKSLATSLQSAFMSSSSTVIATGGANYQVADLVRQMRAESTRTVYSIAGLAEHQQGNAVFIYDEDTKELVGIKSPEAEIRFKFDNRGNTRAWEATIVKSPDGTTGTFSIEATSSTWKTYTIPTPMAPYSCRPIATKPRPRSTPTYYPTYQPSYPPSAEPSPMWSEAPSPEPTASEGDVIASGGGGLIGAGGGAYVVSQTYPAPGYTADPNYPEYGDDFYDDEYEDPCGPDPNWVAPSPPPFKFLANEYPEFVDKVSFKFVVKPKGDEKLAFEMAGTLDDPENVPNSSARIPTHWTYMARIPGVYFDWESQLELRPNNSTFDAKGKMLVEVEEGEEAFTYTLGLKEAQRTGTFALTNVGAKMQLLITGDAPQYGGSPSIHTRLLSTEDGSEVGTIEMKQGSYNVAVVKFKDGTTKDYELFPMGLIPMGPPPTPTYPGPEPTYYN